LSDEVEDAAGVGAAAGAAAAGVDDSADALAAGALSPPDDSLELAAGFADPYPSLYQPPPFSEKAGAEMTRFSAPPQCGQMVISGSENFWIFSVC